MIRKVVISPFAPPWFEKTLRAAVEKFGIDIPIFQSDLAAEPFF